MLQGRICRIKKFFKILWNLSWQKLLKRFRFNYVMIQLRNNLNNVTVQNTFKSHSLSSLVWTGVSPVLLLGVWDPPLLEGVNSVLSGVFVGVALTLSFVGIILKLLKSFLRFKRPNWSIRPRKKPPPIFCFEATINFCIFGSIEVSWRVKWGWRTPPTFRLRWFSSTRRGEPVWRRLPMTCNG